MTKKTRNSSAAKKLVPAVAMLTTSAIMLSTATYAWFTMSKEVSVEGIQLTATSPELIEISYGKVTSGALVAPTNDKEDTDLWVHHAATGSVYTGFGKLSPASSVDGVNLFYNTDPSKQGKSVNAGSSFTAVRVLAGAEDQDDEALKALKDNRKTTEDHDDLTDQESDGYYIDVPVWFRTTKQSDVPLSVKATITGKNETTDTELYKATRIAILDAAADNDGTNTVNNIPACAGVIKNSDATYYTSDTNPLKTAAVLQAVSTAGTASASSYGTTDIVTQYVSDTSKGETVATVPAATQGNAYSTPKKYIIRIWLEGEDTACWDFNASQSFVIGLEFHDASST